jgi:hypothetical protein
LVFFDGAFDAHSLASPHFYCWNGRPRDRLCFDRATRASVHRDSSGPGDPVDRIRVGETLAASRSTNYVERDEPRPFRLETLEVVVYLILAAVLVKSLLVAHFLLDLTNRFLHTSFDLLTHVALYSSGDVVSGTGNLLTRAFALMFVHLLISG